MKGWPSARLRGRFVWHVASATGVSVAQQVIGLGRQIIIAAVFGLSREFDGYVVAYALATMVVFNLTGVFDAIVVSRLVQIRERESEAAFWRASNRVLLQSFIAGVVFAAGFVLLLWLVLPLIAAGFTPPERAYVAELAWYFVPWIAAIIPYYALSAHLKATWQFTWVFAAELLAMVVSILAIWADHASVHALPLAYGAGYASAALLLFLRRGLRVPKEGAVTHDLVGSMGQQYLSVQVGTASGFADRYFQSFIMPGGISALGYVGLIVNNISSLLTFRDIYVVPLAKEADRGQRLERMLQGIVLITVPIAIFVVVYAQPVIHVLFQRGRFTSEAAELTATVLRIQAISLIFSTIMLPLERILAITGRLFFVQIRYAAALVGTLVFQALFVLYLKLDVIGVVWGGICNGVVLLALMMTLVRRCGIVVRWVGAIVNAVYAGCFGAVGVALSWPVASQYTGLTELIIAVAIYGIVMGVGFLILRRRLLAIVAHEPQV